MNQLLLTPTDVLFFRDGRPMSGSLSGHGAAWPLPTVTNAALHAALWRAGAAFDGVHRHRRGKSGKYDQAHRDRKFGSLVTAGPFPVLNSGEWLFPCPLDAGLDEKENETTGATFLPLAKDFDPAGSNLPGALKYAVARRHKATKKTPSPWWNKTAWESYLAGTPKEPKGFKDSDFADTEFNYGIGMDPGTGTQDGDRFYSAHYLRLQPGCRLGLLASARDQDFRDKDGRDDLIAAIFPNAGAETPIIVGGQQRMSTVRRDDVPSLALPRGKSRGFNPHGDKWLVKWVLLSPAVFPEINGHLGGWLPSWVNQKGEVQLLDGPGKNSARRHGVSEGRPIEASLVAALTGKPVPVTGYALPHETTEDHGGSKHTYLAVPAGSVYYFDCTSAGDAEKLAAALNWHGRDDFSTVRNRRSTLFGEKGFGLGVCGSWEFYDGKCPD